MRMHEMRRLLYKQDFQEIGSIDSLLLNKQDFQEIKSVSSLLQLFETSLFAPREKQHLILLFVSQNEPELSPDELFLLLDTVLKVNRYSPLKKDESFFIPCVQSCPELAEDFLRNLFRCAIPQRRYNKISLEEQREVPGIKGKVSFNQLYVYLNGLLDFMQFLPLGWEDSECESELSSGSLDHGSTQDDFLETEFAQGYQDQDPCTWPRLGANF